MLKNNLVTVILTFGRAKKVETYKTLIKCGYTGPVLLVLSDDDTTIEDYRKEFKSKPNVQIAVFNKQEAAKTFDTGDNFDDYRAVVYARNAVFDIVKDLGYEYFFVLDDDYSKLFHTVDDRGEFVTRNNSIINLDTVLDLLVDYFKTIDATSIAMAQTGELMGGATNDLFKKLKRKVMNSFICSVNRKFEFMGRINEDVNAYVHLGSKGHLFLTISDLCILQKQTQANSGGLTEIYLSLGTYVKSFYTVMYNPSSVKIGIIGTAHPRIHHRIDWRYTIPQILDEKYRKEKRNAKTS